jgi:hypothetical protein
METKKVKAFGKESFERAIRKNKEVVLKVLCGTQ